MKSECDWQEARDIAQKSFRALGLERVALSQSFGRVLNGDVIAPSDLPAFITSSMDGWAVSGPGPWKIIGEVHAGTNSEISLLNGSTLRIATGAEIPKGADSVLPWEIAIEDAQFIHGRIAVGENLRPTGAECQKGEVIASTGIKITAAHVGFFAAVGLDEVEVVIRPRVALFYLGDELIHEGTAHDGLIRDALGVQIPLILKQSGCVITNEIFIKDDVNQLISHARNSLDSCDIIITTGGTADGPRDFVKPMFEAINATYLIDRVRVRPGYHILISRVELISGRNVIFIALPGNPQSAIAALTAFGIPIINSLSGLENAELTEVELALTLKAPSNFSRHVPGRIREGKFHPAQFLGSAMLRGLAASDGFAVLLPGENLQGAKVRWIPLQC